jgi:hypothetical protein
MAEQLLSYVNAAVIAYGPTGSGKTYTMLGDLGPHEAPGKGPKDGSAARGSTAPEQGIEAAAAYGGVRSRALPERAGLVPRLLHHVCSRLQAPPASQPELLPPSSPPQDQQGAAPGCATPGCAPRRASRLPATPQGGLTPSRPRLNSRIPATPLPPPPPPLPQQQPCIAAPTEPPARHQLRLSMLQIYQEGVFDLLRHTGCARRAERGRKGLLCAPWQQLAPGPRPLTSGSGCCCARA